MASSSYQKARPGEAFEIMPIDGLGSCGLFITRACIEVISHSVFCIALLTYLNISEAYYEAGFQTQVTRGRDQLGKYIVKVAVVESIAIGFGLIVASNALRLPVHPSLTRYAPPNHD